MLTLLPYHAPASSSTLWWFRDSLLLELLIVGLLPAFIALAKHHPETGKIILVNLLFGWTGIGWLFALVAAVRAPSVIELHVCRNCHSVGMPKVRNAKWFFGAGA
jgi:Superinfection immunity protein